MWFPCPFLFWKCIGDGRAWWGWLVFLVGWTTSHWGCIMGCWWWFEIYRVGQNPEEGFVILSIGQMTRATLEWYPQDVITHNPPITMWSSKLRSSVNESFILLIQNRLQLPIVYLYWPLLVNQTSQPTDYEFDQTKTSWFTVGWN